MLVSNQRPLPCECEGKASRTFVDVRKHLQMTVFALRMSCRRSPPFARVGVLLV
jgi:hypothetical protein